ncbi:hypothetical protein [Streptomyces sp. NPDC048445]|uniref:hypothetical protein n=1 Tax=Streptomyces sp. NPDC048445 TaxID=3365553 RepID=UPI0037147162
MAAKDTPPSVDTAEAAAAYQRGQDLMRAEAERRQAVAAADADARTAAADAAS